MVAASTGAGIFRSFTLIGSREFEASFKLKLNLLADFINLFSIDLLQCNLSDTLFRSDPTNKKNSDEIVKENIMANAGSWKSAVSLYRFLPLLWQPCERRVFKQLFDWKLWYKQVVHASNFLQQHWT